MGEDKSGKLKEKDNRPVLGNITNQLGKRPFSLISTSPPPSSKSKSENTNTINVVDDTDTDTDSSFWKQVTLVVEKLEKERSSTTPKCPKVVNEVGLSPLKGGKTYRLLNSSNTAKKSVVVVGGLRNVVNDAKEPSSSALDSIDLDSVVNVGDTAKKGCEEKMAEGSKSCDKEVSDSVHEVEVLSAQTVVTDNVTMNRGGDCVATSRVRLDVSPRVTEMKGFGLERCAALKGDGGGGCSLGAGVDSIKDCSCSFCTKAAYIWSDLHYQDVKSRMSTLGKSMKEASNLAQKYIAGTEMGSHALENATNEEQLESDLMNKWRSLFLHMEEILASEGSQLEKQLLALKDLREDFKMNLEMTTGVPVDVQQSSSEASDHTT